MAQRADGDSGRRPAHAAGGRLPDVHGAGAYLVDAEGLVVEVNHEAEVMLGRRAHDIVGRDAHDLLHRDSHGHTLPRGQCPMLRTFEDGRARQGEAGYAERGDGSLLTGAWLVAPCGIGGSEPGALVLFHEPAPPHAADASEITAHMPLSQLDRLALLAETTSLLTSTMNTEETVRRLARLVVPRIADWAVIDLVTEGEEVWRTLVVHHEGDALVRHPDLEGPLPAPQSESPMPLERALRGAASSVVGPETYRGPLSSGLAVAQRRLIADTGMHTAAIAPIPGLRDVLGALTVGRSETAGTFADLPLLEDIARRAGLALDNARMYQRQRHVAETMQRHLLPQLPAVPGLDMTARYLAAPKASQVGGDWYDTFRLLDGTVAVAIGDVVGHDIDAAAAMAQVRNILRGYAWSYTEPPSLILTRLDQAVENVTEASMATVFFTRVEYDDTGRCLLRWANAGHPPPLLVTHDGRARFLDDGPDPVIGTGLTSLRTDLTADFPPRATLVLYTDGLIESPARSVDDGLSRLRRHATALVQRPLDTFCDLLLARVRPDDNDDDVAVLALRRPGTE